MDEKHTYIENSRDRSPALLIAHARTYVHTSIADRCARTRIKTMSLRGHDVRDTCVHIADAVGRVKAEPDALLNARAKVRPHSNAAYGYDFYRG